MPNQIANTKERKSLTEHEAVFAALTEIARQEGSSEMAVMRQALREFIAKYADDPVQRQRLRASVMQFAPQPPQTFNTPAELARFKRRQRAFDQLLLDLNLDTPTSVDARNSVISPGCEMHVLELEGDYESE